MRNFVYGFIVALAAIALSAYVYFALGLAPVATAAPPIPFEETLAHAALHAVVNRQAPKTVPIAANVENYSAGARIYRNNCAGCHGLPDQPEAAIAHGMFPKPPQLFKDMGVTDDPPGVTYWKAANGIRLTGMPAFKGSLSDTELWQVSLMLANADKLPASVRGTLSAPLPQ